MHAIFAWVLRILLDASVLSWRPSTVRPVRRMERRIWIDRECLGTTPK